MQQNAVPRITPTVPASPSIPSSRFTAFTAPSSQHTVKGTASSPSSKVAPNSDTRSTSVPVEVSSRAARIWANSFCRPRSSRASS